jgi:hypothetical protein
MTLKQYLDTLIRSLRDAFGETLAGVLLSGSASVGAYVQGRSDIDVLVAVDGASREQLQRVVATCAHEVLPCPATKLELVVYELDELAAPAERPQWSLNFDTGATTHQVDFDPATQPSHWFVLDLAFARRHAVPLFGDAEIGDPGDEAVGRAFDEMVAWFEANEPDALPVARERADHWRKTGTFKPKPGLPSP